MKSAEQHMYLGWFSSVSCGFKAMKLKAKRWNQLSSQVPGNTPNGKYRLRLEGTLAHTTFGFIFQNETDIEFSTKQASLFIQMSKPLYRQGDKGQSSFCLLVFVFSSLFLFSPVLEHFKKFPSFIANLSCFLLLVIIFLSQKQEWLLLLYCYISNCFNCLCG